MHESAQDKFVEWVSGDGAMLMLITFFPMDCFEMFTFYKRPPVLQTDANLCMIKRVLRETEAFKFLGPGTSAAPINWY